MADEWEETPSLSNNTEAPAFGKVFGTRGRGFKPAVSNGDYGGVGQSGGGYRGRDNGDDGGGRRGGGGYRGRDNDEEGGGRRGGGGFRGRDNDEDGGGRRGGGGFRGRDNDEAGGGRRGGGGFRGRDNDEDGGGRRGGGGFRGRDNDEEGGGRRGGGGFRGRDNDEDGGGRRGGGGFRGRDNDEDGGGRRGGFRSRENDDNGTGGGGDGDENGEVKPPKMTYVPPEAPTSESDIFNEGITTGIHFNNYEKIDVKVSGDKAPKPISSFEEAGLRPLILENILRSNYKKPTPIQKQALPIVMAGRDLMGCAQTGSGKTAAFLIPIINNLLSEPSDLVTGEGFVEPQVVIVSPTRELTIQIYTEARKFAFQSVLKVVECYGGTSTAHQLRRLFDGCHILVATPGRLMDFVNRGKIQFGSVRFVVLDEADRMLDMGFIGEMEKLMSHPTMSKSGDRQTLMFSATFPEEIQRLAGKFLNDYLFVAVGIVGGACSDVQQNFYPVGKFQKREKLVELLNEHGSKRTLVFVEQKKIADVIATYLSEKDFPTTSIHGDREQREREEALSDFKRGKMDILVATAVAARGLDIKEVRHVINYDLPKSIDEFVHRIGRTGRVGNKGLASSFFDASMDGPLVPDLKRILRQAQQVVPDFLEEGGGGGNFGGSTGGGGSSRFGGRDVRNDNNFEAKPVTYDEENWD